MRRLLCLLVLAFLALGGAVGCGGTTGGEMMTDGGGGNGSLALFAACTDNSDCMSGLCTQDQLQSLADGHLHLSVRRQRHEPEAAPMGCNPKGYCKQPM